MRFLSVARRELGSAARNRRTYYTRCFTAAGFLAFLTWLFWVFDALRGGRVSNVFQVFSVGIFFYSLLIGTALTADSISAEKRDGTLGLLFLTNLNRFEIIAGKLSSCALAALYGIVAIFPMLALMFLLGGITLEHFWKTVLALLNAIYFATAIGFFASVICSRQFTAIATALGLAVLFGAGPMLAAAIANEFRASRWLAEFCAPACPLYGLISADGSTVFSGNHFWASLALIAVASTLTLVFVAWRLGRIWQDRPKSSLFTQRLKLFQRVQESRSAGRAALRRRLLDINPFFWLGSRQRVSAPVFMIIFIALVLFTECVTAPFFSRVLRAGELSPLVGHLFAWMWTGLALHGLVLYHAAMAASRRTAEDKTTGALELILSTPATERQISRGFWLAFARRMFFPALAVVLVHGYFIWIAASLIVMDPPSPLPAGFTPGKLIWETIFHPTSLGPHGGWEYRFMLQVVLEVLVFPALAWVTLGWVARWLGLRMKHPGFAPIVSLALIVVPTVLMITLIVYTISEFKLYRLPERKFLPLIAGAFFVAGVTNCIALSLWASQRLRNHFRYVVTGHFQPREPHRWLPRPRTVIRFSLGAIGAAAALALMVFGYFSYQNRRSERAWASFQSELKRKGESLDVAKMLPAIVPDVENFARSAAFQELVSGKSALTPLLKKPPAFNFAVYGSASAGMEWAWQKFSPLDSRATWFASKTNLLSGTNAADFAAVILRGLKPHEHTLAALAESTKLPHMQISTTPPERVVLSPPREPIQALEQLHFLFQVRACALLSVGREAATDLNTLLRLTQLSRELPDAESSLRAQTLAVHSLQPLWEGLTRHQWNESQLANFQSQLAAFDLLADHTNAVQRMVLAHLAAWKAVMTNNVERGLPTSRGGYIEREQWRYQPRGWTLDLCAQLYRAGENSIRRVDFASGRFDPELNWEDFNGLPLSGEAMQLLQQAPWLGQSPVLAAFAQTSVNQAVIACALERFYLANGKFPESLDELLPTYLASVPRDLMRGRPMIYQRTDDAHFILRGVGANGNDDRKSRSSDDWLWSYATNAPPVKAISE